MTFADSALSRLATRPVVVIGAGIVGTLTALRLRHQGAAVVLVDPAPPGSGASSGNAGCFSPSSIVPLSGPGVLAQVPRWLFDPSGPLALRWSYLPRLAPWLARFVAAGRGDRPERQAAALHALIDDSLERLLPLLRDIGAGGLVRNEGSLIVYRTETSWANDEAARRLRRSFGITFDTLERPALRAFDPALTPDVIRALFFPRNGHSVSPQALVTTLAEAYVRLGGVVFRANALEFEIASGRLEAVVTDAGRIEASAAVIAAGAFSAGLAKRLGHSIPLETERGYHVMATGDRGLPRLPTVDAAAKFVATPMNDGIRLAGMVEFAGLNGAPDWRKANALARLGAVLYPGLIDAAAPMMSRWMGHRPSLPDSLPIIDFSHQCRDIILAFGHGHLGLTAAPHTADIVTNLVLGRPAGIDMSPYSLGRFT